VRFAGPGEAVAGPATGPAGPGTEDAGDPALLLEEGPELDPVPAEGPAPAVAEPPAAPGVAWGWPVWALAVWAGVSLLTFGVAAWRIRQFRRLLALAEPASEATRAEVEALAGRLGLGRTPAVRRLPGAVSPMVWALGCRPCLI